MAAGDAELAVHSMKDVPAELPEGFTLAAVLPRADARDAFVSRRYARLADLPLGARVGTSSQRRQSLLQFGINLKTTHTASSTKTPRT